jgi:hypothetical protein
MYLSHLRAPGKGRWGHHELIIPVPGSCTVHIITNSLHRLLPTTACPLQTPVEPRAAVPSKAQSGAHAALVGFSKLHSAFHDFVLESPRNPQA